MRNAARNETTTIRHPGATRPWQHVLEPLLGYLLLGRQLLSGDVACADAWNFGPRESDAAPVRNVVTRFEALWPAVRAQFVEERTTLHEAGTLRLDSSRASRHLGWQPVWTLDQAISRTVQWYENWSRAGHSNSREDLADFTRAAAEILKTSTETRSNRFEPDSVTSNHRS
ncbi:MAG: hypothetical protein QM784_03980 [Polyangiaceae bacterium]